jgi:hypothetical protein
MTAVAADPFERADLEAPTSSWTPVDLSPIVRGIEAGEIVGPTPSLLPRTDGVPLLYPGEVHSLAGEPESGKGWLAGGEVARLLAGGASVLYLDFEDAPASVVARQVALGARASAIVDRFVYVRPEEALQPGALERLLAGRTFALAVLDGMSEAYALLGFDSYANQDVPRFLQALPRPIAATGAAVLLIDHVVKDREARGRYALGAQHKLAGVAVAYAVEVLESPSRARAGTVKVIVAKDRHGHVRGHASGNVIALAKITPSDDGERVTVELDPPDSLADDGGFRPTTLMQRISHFVESSPGATKRDVREYVTGNSEYKDRALVALIAEGWLRVERDGRAQRHYSVAAFDENAPCPRAQDVPDRAQGTPCAHVPNVPPSYKEGHEAQAHNGTTQTLLDVPTGRRTLPGSTGPSAGHGTTPGHGGRA